MYYIIIDFIKKIHYTLNKKSVLQKGGDDMAAQQFLYAEYLRLLERVILNTSGFYHCRPETVQTIRDILYTDYPYQEDDIEFLMDMTNYYIRQSGYSGKKSRFPISKYLDMICQEELYLNLYKKDNLKQLQV